MHSLFRLSRPLSQVSLRSLRAACGGTAFAALTGVISASAAHAQILTNGSFETGSFSGWTVNSSATYVEASGGAGGYTAQDGRYYAALGHQPPPQSNALGTISQSFTTVLGQQYNLSYYLASTGVIPNQFIAEVNGQQLFNQTNIAAQPFTLYSFNFTANTTTSTLTFSNRDDASYLGLDNVSVTRVGGGTPALTPEAPALVNMAGALLAPGLGGLLTLRKRRKKA